MEEIKYPIGMQYFPDLIEGGFTYVDKTHLIARLIKGKYIFLSRPRRFGKSLLLSTIHSYFDGKRELFRGLAIDSMDVDWIPRPVLYFDFNPEDYGREDALDCILDTLLSRYEEVYGCKQDDITPSQRLRRIIEAAYRQSGEKVVILVDEYDKPLLGLEQDTDLYEKRQTLLKGFFSNLKSLDGYIRFAMLTGVARFSKVSIFSDLNNLEDISMDDAYADICGWTETELTENFQQGIKELAEYREETPEETLTALRDYYDGYLFAPNGSLVYNPFSVLRALKSKAIFPYWYDTGTPTFLAKWIRKSGIEPGSINGRSERYSNLMAVGFGAENVLALMFQTGYLTIASYDARRQKFSLRFPNREVEIGFAENLLPLYAPATAKFNGPFNLEEFRDDLDAGDPNSFMERLEGLFKGLPGEDHKESTYRAITYLLCLLSGSEASAERHTYKGRSDLEILTPDYVYVLEFKYNKSVKEAMEQIHSRDYAGRFAKDPRQVFLIGASYIEDKENRRLEYEVEKMPK